MGAAPSKTTSSAASSSSTSSTLNEKQRVQDVTESMSSLTVKSGGPLSSDGTISLENFREWDHDIAKVCLPSRRYIPIASPYRGTDLSYNFTLSLHVSWP